MRHAFRTGRDCVEAWARRSEGLTYGHAGHVSFDGRYLYSYAALIAKEAMPGKNAAFVINKRYSKTTTRHKSMAAHVMSSLGRTIIPVEIIPPDVDGLDVTHTTNIEAYKAKMLETVLKFDRTNTSWKALSLIAENTRIAKNVRDYCGIFKLKVPVLLGLEMSGTMPHIAKRFYSIQAESGPAGNFREARMLFLPKWIVDIGGFNSLKPEHFVKVKNAEIRRAMIEKFGPERITETLRLVLISEDGSYFLYRTKIDRRVCCFLRMRNPSVDAWHIEAVHPACQTVQQALNWRRYGDEVLERIPWGERRRELLRNPENRQFVENPNCPDWKPSKLT